MTQTDAHGEGAAMPCHACVVSDGCGVGRTLARALANHSLTTEWATLPALLSRDGTMFDVVVVDGTDHRGDLTGAVAQARDHIRGPVVVLTPDASESTLMPPLVAGARAVVLRTSGADVLSRAVHAVRAGDMFIDPALGAKLADLAAVASGHGRTTELTPTELRVLQRFPSGMTNAEMAEDLGVTVNTIKTHVRHILGKFDSDDRTQAIRVARQRGLLP